MLILGRNISIFLSYIFNNHLCFQNSSAIARQLLILLYYPLDDILQIFYDKDDLNSGLYEGTVRGRRLFTSSAIPHGQGTIYYFNNDKYHRVNYTGDWVDGTREGNGTTNFKDGSVYRGTFNHKCLFHSISRFSDFGQSDQKTKKISSPFFSSFYKKSAFCLISFG